MSVPNFLKDDIISGIHDTLKEEKPEFEFYESKVKPGKPTLINNGWDDKKIRHLRAWIEENKIYNWLLKTTSAYYSAVETGITIPLIIFTLSGLALSFLASTIDNSSNCNHVNIYIIASVIVQILGSILVLIKTFLGLSKIISGCNVMSRKFSALNNDIEGVLVELVEERINGTLYLREKSKERSALLTNMPDIPDRIWRKFDSELEKGSIIDIETSVLMKQIKFQQHPIKSTKSNRNGTNNNNTNSTNKVTETPFVIDLDNANDVEEKVSDDSNTADTKKDDDADKIRRINNIGQQIKYGVNRW